MFVKINNFIDLKKLPMSIVIGIIFDRKHPLSESKSILGWTNDIV